MGCYDENKVFGGVILVDSEGATLVVFIEVIGSKRLSGKAVIVLGFPVEDFVYY